MKFGNHSINFEGPLHFRHHSPCLKMQVSYGSCKTLRWRFFSFFGGAQVATPLGRAVQKQLIESALAPKLLIFPCLRPFSREINHSVFSHHFTYLLSSLIENSFYSTRQLHRSYDPKRRRSSRSSALIMHVFSTEGSPFPSSLAATWTISLVGYPLGSKCLIAAVKYLDQN